MSNYKQILYHIVFSTKKRTPSLTNHHRKDLYRYIWGIIKNKKAFLYRINGTTDHIHILSDLPTNLALADFIRDIKVASSIWMKQSGLFPYFNGWEVGYGAFTCDYRIKDRLIDYIKNQEKHHVKTSFQEEYSNLLKEYNVTVDGRFFP